MSDGANAMGRYCSESTFVEVDFCYVGEVHSRYADVFTQLDQNLHAPRLHKVGNKCGSACIHWDGALELQRPKDARLLGTIHGSSGTWGPSNS